MSEVAIAAPQIVASATAQNIFICRFDVTHFISTLLLHVVVPVTGTCRLSQTRQPLAQRFRFNGQPGPPFAAEDASTACESYGFWRRRFRAGDGWIRLQHKQPAVSVHRVSTRSCEEKTTLQMTRPWIDAETRLNSILDKRRKMIFGIDIVYINTRLRNNFCIDKTDSAGEYCSFVEWGPNLYARFNV